MRNNLKAWIDDFTLHAESEEKLLDVLHMFLVICKSKGLLISASKSKFFQTSIKWCGRIISKEGFKLDPRRIEGLKDTDVPRFAGELCEFVHCCRWMSSCIPNFSERISTLNAVLENAYQVSKRRTKRSVKNLRLAALGWTEDHTICYRSIQDSLREAVQLSYPKNNLTTCIFTDASSMFWSAIVT